MRYISFRIMLSLRWILFKDRVKRFIYCRRGWHKVRNGSMSTTNSKKQTIETNCVKCVYCNTIFFPTEKDKKNFLRIEEKKWENTKKFIEALTNKKVKNKGKIKTKGFDEK